MISNRVLSRSAALRALLLEITLGAVGLVLFLLVLAFFSGEGGFALVREEGLTRLELIWSRPLWSSRLATILGWDLLLFLATVWGLRWCPSGTTPVQGATSTSDPNAASLAVNGTSDPLQERLTRIGEERFQDGPGKSRRDGCTPTHGHNRCRREEALLALVLTLFLWRIIAASIGTLLVPSLEPATAGNGLPGVGETLLILGVLVVGKLRLASTLESTDRRFDSPVLAVACWHHRKDAIFNLLFALTLLAAWSGYAPGQLDRLLHFAKLGLLGTATIGICDRVARQLTADAADVSCQEKGSSC